MLRILREKLLGQKASSNRAKSRLQFVLVQDRSGLTADDMSKFKEELVDVIGRYFVLDKQGFDVSYKRAGDSTTLLINSPVLVRRQDSPDKKVGAKAAEKKEDSTEQEQVTANA